MKTETVQTGATGEAAYTPTLRIREFAVASLTGGPIVENEDGSFFCECATRADAASIVRACNEHAALQQQNAALVKALRHIRITAGFADGNAELNRDRLASIAQDVTSALKSAAT